MHGLSIIGPPFYGHDIKPTIVFKVYVLASGSLAFSSLVRTTCGQEFRFPYRVGEGGSGKWEGGGVYGTLGVGGSVTGQSTTGYCLYSASKLVLVRCKCPPQ